MINRANLKAMTKSRLIVLLLEQDERLTAKAKEIDLLKLQHVNTREASAATIRHMRGAYSEATKRADEELDVYHKANERHKARIAEQAREIAGLKAEIARLDKIASKVIVKAIHAEFKKAG